MKSKLFGLFLGGLVMMSAGVAWGESTTSLPQDNKTDQWRVANTAKSNAAGTTLDLNAIAATISQGESITVGDLVISRPASDKVYNQASSSPPPFPDTPQCNPACGPWMICCSGNVCKAEC
jgi:hypothetical protein